MVILDFIPIAVPPVAVLVVAVLVIAIFDDPAPDDAACGVTILEATVFNVTAPIAATRPDVCFGSAGCRANERTPS